MTILLTKKAIMIMIKDRGEVVYLRRKEGRQEKPQNDKIMEYKVTKKSS